MAHAQRITKEMQSCIDVCQECHAVCTEAVLHCLTLGGEHAEAHHVQLLLACAEICRTSATFMELGSDLHVETCGVCSTVCTRCAEGCERFAEDDVMQRCAEVCRRCAESCREMAVAGRAT